MIAEEGCGSVSGLPLSHFPAEMPQALAAAFRSRNISHSFFFFLKVKHRPLCFMSCQLSGLLPSPLTTSQLQQMERSTFVQGGLGHGVCLCASVGAPCRGSPVEGRTTATLPGRSFKPPPPTSNLRLILHSTAKSDNNFSAPNPGTELYSLQSPFYSQSLI